MIKKVKKILCKLSRFSHKEVCKKIKIKDHKHIENVFVEIEKLNMTKLVINISTTTKKDFKFSYKTVLFKYNSMLFYYEFKFKNSEPEKILDAHYSIEEIKKEYHKLKDVLELIDELIDL